MSVSGPYAGPCPSVYTYLLSMLARWPLRDLCHMVWPVRLTSTYSGAGPCLASVLWRAYWPVWRPLPCSGRLTVARSLARDWPVCIAWRVDVWRWPLSVWPSVVLMVWPLSVARSLARIGYGLARPCPCIHARWRLALAVALASTCGRPSGASENKLTQSYFFLDCNFFP
jgi:hypothetical protein